jgi:hypothetical protein
MRVNRDTYVIKNVLMPFRFRRQLSLLIQKPDFRFNLFSK